jgi:adenylate cyclase
MVEEVITALSRIPWLFVIARNSSFTYRGQDIDVKQVGRELGVRYVLEGAVQKAARRLRITAQLIEAESGVHLWADRFDGSLEDVFDLQDTVASSVASVIEPALQVGEIRRASQRPTNDLTAYDLYLRAMPFFWSLSRDGIHQALALLGQAIDCDAQFGPALAWAAICHLRLHQDGWTEDPEMTFQRGRDFASRALQRAASDPGVIANAVFPLAYFGENITAMMAVLDECLVLNPNFARGWFVSGHLRLMAGHCDTAIEHAERSLRLSPRIRNGAHWGIVGMGHFFSRRFELAAAKLLVQIHELPGSPSSYRFLAATYAHMGQLNEARKVIAQIRAITPLLMQPMIYRIPEHRELYVSGLSLAAGE